MATHSSVLAWRIPGTGEPGGLLLCLCTESDTTERLGSSSSSMGSRLHFLAEEVTDIASDSPRGISLGQRYRKFECSTWMPHQYRLTLLEAFQAILSISKFLPN